MSAGFIRTTLLALTLGAAAQAFAAEKPKLVINIVVSSMRADDIDRYASNFSSGGFRRLTEGGAVFTDSRYNYMQTLTPVSLATLSTGAMPSTHGVVSRRWSDYANNNNVYLTADDDVTGLDCRDGKGCHSPRNLIAPTLNDAMIQADSCSRSVTIAIDPESAGIMGGRSGFSFWIDDDRCRWATSSYYTPYLPGWVKEYNDEDLRARFLTGIWQSRFNKDKYINSRHSSIVMLEQMTKETRPRQISGEQLRDIEKIERTPVGNTLLLDFAKYAITSMNLGADDHTDVLNICLDTSRNIAERFGPESVEYEDMLYRLDYDLDLFLDYVCTLVKDERSILVVFTSDHGTSPSYDKITDSRKRFNVRQFEVIVNAFLSARYGQGQWILGYIDHSIYINHNLVYDKDMSIADIQNEVATFAMQFRGVSHALSSTAMRTSYFGSGYAQKMQNSFYPRRSGDVIINLMPEWIEEREECRSHSGSMYGYDTHVPLIFWGAGIAPQRHDEPVDMTSVAPTTARLIGISEPAASEGTVLKLK